MAQLQSTFPVLHSDTLIRIIAAEEADIFSARCLLKVLRGPQRVTDHVAVPNDSRHLTKSLQDNTLKSQKWPPGGNGPRKTREWHYWIGDAGIVWWCLTNPADCGGNNPHRVQHDETEEETKFGTVCDLLRDSFRWTHVIGWRNYSGPVEPCRSWDGTQSSLEGAAFWELPRKHEEA